MPASLRDSTPVAGIHPAPAFVRRRNPPALERENWPNHVSRLRVPAPLGGDPFFRYNGERSSDVYNVGKPFAFPGTHENHYTAVPYLQGIMERFWGQVSTKLYYRRGIKYPAGHARSIGPEPNIEVPARTTVGDLFTVLGRNRDRIRTGRGVS